MLLFFFSSRHDYIFFFFFFQAEDGIRDYKVTGVQTCALPISEPIADLRRLLYCGEWIESHALHIYLLHAPDFLGYTSALALAEDRRDLVERDRKSTRLNSSHLVISYAVFCLKKKKNNIVINSQ